MHHSAGRRLAESRKKKSRIFAALFTVFFFDFVYRFVTMNF